MFVNDCTEIDFYFIVEDKICCLIINPESQVPGQAIKHEMMLIRNWMTLCLVACCNLCRKK